MGETIVEAVRAFLGLLGRATGGDAEAMERLKDILGPDLHTRLVSETQDQLDRAKFGPRGDEHTQPTRPPGFGTE